MKRSIWIGLIGVSLAVASEGRAADIGTAFTYQGHLEDGGGPMTDTCDFRFGLWDAVVAGNQKGTSPQTVLAVAVTAGVFTATMDFGSGAIDGTARWLEIEVCCSSPCAPGALLLLIPRMELTPAPHAVRAWEGVGPPNTLEVDTVTGGVGIGTIAPEKKLDVRGDIVAQGTPSTNSDIRMKKTGPLSESNIEFNLSHRANDTELWMFGYNGTTFLNFQGFDYAGNAVRFPADGNTLTVDLGLGRVGIGDASPDAKLDVENSSASVAVFNRLSNDGNIIALQQDGNTEGAISVSGATVSYNAFTGSHYAWTNERIERGALVSLTGDNRRRTDNPGAEPSYGITASTLPNDSKCLGAYLGLLEPGQPPSPENPHQVMSVGNGDMWVVDSGRSIEPGQYLISSDMKGHAMLDDELRFPVGYVIARAAEPVDWSKVSDTVEGRKHTRISVFFESFERGSAAAVGKTIAAQQAEIDALKSRLAAMESALSGIIGAAHPVSSVSLGVFVVPALVLLGVIGLIARGRSQNGGGR